MDMEVEQRIAVGEIAAADLIDAPIKDPARSVTGLCRSADDGSRTEEFYDEDAARASLDPKPRLTDGSSLKSAETQDERASLVIADQAAGQLPSPLLPELVPPMMHIHIAERKRIKKARIKER